MFTSTRTAGRRSHPSPLPARAPAPAPTFASSSDALRARATASRLRDQAWDDIQALTESESRPADYTERLTEMNGRLLAAQHALTAAERWLNAQPRDAEPIAA